MGAPGVIAAADAAAATTLAQAPAAAAAPAAANNASQPPADPNCPPKPCPPCQPPVGTVAYEVHRCPPSKPHWPCKGDHIHWFRRQQNPKNCQCFWQRNFQDPTCLDSGADPAPFIPPGAVPM